MPTMSIKKMGMRTGGWSEERERTQMTISIQTIIEVHHYHDVPNYKEGLEWAMNT